jgi:16S rRNA (guanine966-N2)-methyltransferase
LRITGGRARGRKLTVPRSDLIRPTCDRVREALFNIIGQRVAGCRILDLFAGTGAVGIECLSRGATFALFVDQSLEAGRLIEANIRACIPKPQASFVQLNLETAPNLHSLQAKMEPGAFFDLVFMDPPYHSNLAQRVLAMVASADVLSKDALIVVEEHRRATFPETVASLTLADQRRYGETGLWFYASPSKPSHHE